MIFKKYRPEEMSAELRHTIVAGSLFLGTWHQAVQPSHEEVKRLAIGMFLLPLSLASFFLDQRNKKLAEAWTKVPSLYLQYYAEPDELVSVGDILVWRHELEMVSRVLRERYLQPVTGESLKSAKMTMRMLLPAMAEARDHMTRHDFNTGFALNETASPTERQLNTAQMMALTFSKQIIVCDLHNAAANSQNAERLLLSSKMAIPTLGTLIAKVAQTVGRF